MRVLLSCLQSLKRHPLPPYDFWRSHFVEGCREAGIECLEVPGVDWAEGLVCSPGAELEAWRARTWENVLAYSRREHNQRPINLFLSYLYPKQVETAAIDDLQRMGIATVNFFCDNVREFRQVPVEYRPFTLHWVPEYEALDMYRRANLSYLHAPMPCWIPPELRSPPIKEIEPPTFVGSADILRRDLVGRAMQTGADFVVRGRGWVDGTDLLPGTSVNSYLISRTLLNQFVTLHQHGLGGLLKKVGDKLHPIRPPQISHSNVRDTVSGQAEYFRITRDAMVAIGINRVPTARHSNRHPLVYSRLRDIEAPMLGACYLTEWTEGLGKLYDLSSEIETYRTAEELGERLQELGKDSERRRAMRRRAQRRALSDHSTSRSLARIGARLGFSPRP
jgi:hypothetical protein